MVHLHDFLHRRQSGERGSLRDEVSNLLNGQRERARQDEGVATVFSVVYVTMSASFTGPTAGFVTQTASGQQPNTRTSASLKPTQTSASESRNNSNDQSSVSSRTSQRASSATSTSAESSAPRQTAVVGTPVQATRSGTSASASASPTQDIGQQGGMSGGAKAGVAFGVIAALALIAGIIFFVVRKKKQQQQKEEHESHNLDNEKTGFAFAAMNSTPRSDNPANNRAPRLSLRPVTQFLPSIGDPKVQEMTSATGGLNSFLPPPPPQQQHKSSWERPMPGNHPNDAANPFGNSAERVDTAAMDRAAENAPIPVPVPVAAAAPNPFVDNPASSRSISPVEDSPVVTAGSPTKAEIATAAAVAVVAAPGSTSPKGGPNNVHRVQLDFKPSMEDELELRAGDVVRLLHEYDDGWALCSRMDRSKQGVAPRTCLSKLPLKPRPTGPPPGMRPLNARPESPGMRNLSGPPATGQRGMYPAPLSPSLPNMNVSGGPNSPPKGNRTRAHSRGQSFDQTRRSPQQMHSQGFGTSPQRDHRRSASMGQLGMGASPTKTGAVARKPVPGMAI
ncbi:Ephexin-1 [Sphaceloma murrayae]|uniref:Ephexin-1 n=1 Tax=Sphaceloma murrayae TaxID=2082308 RepID=A0A2K1QMI6_9PEZI|nr:Ephexin-1 [Sphaceloma murrayae]